MRTYLPTFGLLATVAASASASLLAGCAGGAADTGFQGDAGAGDGTISGQGDATTDSKQIVFGDGSLVDSPADNNLAKDSGGSDGSVDTGADTGMTQQTCVHASDCTAPNMCAGNNGMACLGGFCVASNQPATCDDGVPCTTDTCNATTNSCVHTPSDTACPTGEYCDPTLNCVSMLACTPGDAVCDRLDTTVCAGLWSCSAATMYCVHNPAPCPSRPNATTTCSATAIDGGVTVDAGTTGDGGEISAACEWACQSGYVDSNGDLNAAVSAMSNGCECQVTNANDVPDYPGFVDTNCDGIDGTIDSAIFVDTVSGSDANIGTMALPRKTITAGIQAALQAHPVKDVYVSKGTYNEEVTMQPGVNLYGGYDASNKWGRTLANVTTIQSPTSTGVIASNLVSSAMFQFFTVQSKDASGQTLGAGNSSYGIIIASSSGGVTVQGCDVIAGAGAPGVNGTPGASGASGVAGGNAGNGGATVPGPKGGSACGAYGGIGGTGYNGTTNGTGGDNGTTVPGGGQGGQGGPGGSAGVCNSTSSSNGNGPLGPPGSGNPGGPGQNGAAGSAGGSFSAGGIYTPASGGAGVTAGAPGGGGGGGGAGGGSAHGTNIICSNCSGVSGGGGGGGGGGGCGGNPGTGGYGGGGSIPIAVVGSTATIDQTKMSAAKGGNGGNGANGGPGGGPGGGGNAAGGTSDNNSCSNRSGGNGDNGASGGSGGQGGAGAGGPGGPSVCIMSQGGAPVVTGTSCTRVGAGSPGTGGTNGTTQASAGATGLNQDVWP